MHGGHHDTPVGHPKSPTCTHHQIDSPARAARTAQTPIAYPRTPVRRIEAALIRGLFVAPWNTQIGLPRQAPLAGSK